MRCIREINGSNNCFHILLFIEHSEYDYERNRTLIDLTAQPIAFRNATDDIIKSSLTKDNVAQVGVHFMRFCGKYELNRISDQADVYSKWLNTPYEGKLKVG